MKNIEKIRYIFFELSNICNYSYIHKKCPLSDIDKKITLQTNVIKKVIKELKQIDYAGEIAFHVYNEPLIDQRLFYLTEYAKDTCKKSKIRLMTNGFYLTQDLADEIYEYGVDKIEVSLYSQKEEERIRQIQFRNINISFYDYYSKCLDNRKEIYEREVQRNTLPCYSLNTEIIVRHTADVDLCCLDWDMKHLFGNLQNSTLEEILSTPKVQEVQYNLKQGKRYLELCKRCDWQRGLLLEDVGI